MTLDVDHGRNNPDDGHIIKTVPMTYSQGVSSCGTIAQTSQRFISSVFFDMMNLMKNLNPHLLQRTLRELILNETP